MREAQALQAAIDRIVRDRDAELLVERAEQCLRLAEDTDRAYAREALLELAAKFQAIAVQLELAVGGRK